MTQKSSVVIFQALKPVQPQWSHWPHLPQQPQWPHWPQQPHFIKKITHPDGLIIPGTKMTNTSPFLWNGSSKIQFFTDIWSSFCWRLLRTADVIFLKTDWWNTNFQTSWTRYGPYFNKIKDPSTLHSHLLYLDRSTMRHPVVTYLFICFACLFSFELYILSMTF